MKAFEPQRGRVSAAAGARLLAVGLATGLLAAACAWPDPDAGSAESRRAADAALDSVYATFSRAYARANVHILMDEVYAPGAFYLPPGSPILTGQDQFRGQFSFLERYARTEGPGPDISFEIVDRDLDGDLAYDIGVYTIRAPGAPADDPGTRGKFIVIWKRDQRGEWRIHADAFSAMD